MKHLPSKTRIGVVGCGGRITSLLAHIRKIAPDLRITAAFDPSKDSVGRMRDALHLTDLAVCSDARELCQREDVDWVFIGSWNSFHAEQTILAFEAGKHVFCEKPLALSLGEAEAMHAAWRASGRTFSLGLVLRYSPFYQAVKSIIEEGNIGRILSFEFNETLDFNHGGYIHGNWRRNTAHAGSHLLEKCCHDIDLALWLTGERPRRVASFGGCAFFNSANEAAQTKIGRDAKGRNAFQTWNDPDGVNPFSEDKDIVDNQVAILEFDSGIRATFHTQCVAGLPERRFYILGSEGTLRCDAYTGFIEWKQIGWEKSIQNKRFSSGDGHADGDKHMCEKLVQCLTSGEAKPAAGFIEGIHSLAVAQAIDQAMGEGRVVDLTELWNQADAIRVKRHDRSP